MVVSAPGAVNTRPVEWIPYRVFVQNTLPQVVTLEGITLRANAPDMAFSKAFWAGRKVLEPATGDIFHIDAEVDLIAMTADPRGPLEVNVTLFFLLDGSRQSVTYRRNVQR